MDAIIQLKNGQFNYGQILELKDELVKFMPGINIFIADISPDRDLSPIELPMSEIREIDMIMK